MIYPQNEMLSQSTTGYNCHSYAWYSQNTASNDIWISYPNAYYQSSDMSYERVYTPRVGDIICYFDTDAVAERQNIHSGIIVGLSGEASNGVCGNANQYIVQSKWGMNALYEHKGDECPYTSTYGGDADEVRYYRPRTNQSYTVSTTMDDLSISRTINAGGSIVDQYGMYELNVTGGGKFTITIQSDESLDNRLYDANMNRKTMLVSEASAGSYTYVATLSSGRYYLRTAYADLTNSGTISITIEPHTHIYNQWTYYSYATHIESCVCGARGTTKKEHIVDRTQVVNNTATCLVCGHLLDLRFDSSVVESIGGLKVSANGSYILPNGIIVLDPADIEAYFNGTLIFYSREELPETA